MAGLGWQVCVVSREKVGEVVFEQGVMACQVHTKGGSVFAEKLQEKSNRMIRRKGFVCEELFSAEGRCWGGIGSPEAALPSAQPPTQEPAAVSALSRLRVFAVATALGSTTQASRVILSVDDWREEVKFFVVGFTEI